MSEPAKRWFSAAELAALELADFPKTERGMRNYAASNDWQRPAWEGARWRERRDRGGGIEYHVSILPPLTQARVLARFPDPAEVAAPDQGDQAARDALWRRWATLSDRLRDEARARLRVILALEDLVAAGQPRTLALMAVCEANKVSLQTLYNWQRMLEGAERRDWMAALAPLSRASAQPVRIEPEAWDMLRADYLRQERPSFDACFRRLQAVAAERGWTLPSARTLRRRIEAIPLTVRTLGRDGRETLMRMLPAQQRDRGGFHAMEAVNADGHKWDVFVRWPGEAKPVRPMMVAFQDLYSGKILAWRFDKSANRHAVRLAFADLVGTYGIPSACWLDNGRDFASKWITGGTPNRYRFKVRDDEPDGIMTLLGVTVHWTTPYSGQSKPIERAFRDFAGDVAKHPRFAGAYTGNAVDAKPENYMSKAVPLDVFVATVEEAIREHNARPGRRSLVANGRSFDAVFADSYARNPVALATEAQRDLLLLAAEQLRTRADNALHFMGNRYFADFLIGQRRRPLTVRFDPDDLHEGLRVYAANGRFLGHAACMEAAGFASTEAGRDLARTKRAWLKAERAKLEAEWRLTIQQVADMLPRSEPPAPLEAKVVRPLFNGTAALRTAPDEQSNQESEVLAAIRRLTAGRLHVVRPDDGADD